MAKKDKKIDYDTYDSSARVKLGTSDYVIRGIGYVFVTLYALACIFPFLLIIGTSFTSEAVIR
nr:hypothetical protein [Butyrivibrio sp.]